MDWWWKWHTKLYLPGHAICGEVVVMRYGALSLSPHSLALSFYLNLSFSVCMCERVFGVLLRMCLCVLLLSLSLPLSLSVCVCGVLPDSRFPSLTPSSHSLLLPVCVCVCMRGNDALGVMNSYFLFCPTPTCCLLYIKLVKPLVCGSHVYSLFDMFILVFAGGEEKPGVFSIAYGCGEILHHLCFLTQFINGNVV